MRCTDGAQIADAQARAPGYVEAAERAGERRCAHASVSGLGPHGVWAGATSRRMAAPPDGVSRSRQGRLAPAAVASLRQVATGRQFATPGGCATWRLLAGMQSCVSWCTRRQAAAARSGTGRCSGLLPQTVAACAAQWQLLWLVMLRWSCRHERAGHARCEQPAAAERGEAVRRDFSFTFHAVHCSAGVPGPGPGCAGGNMQQLPASMVVLLHRQLACVNLVLHEYTRCIARAPAWHWCWQVGVDRGWCHRAVENQPLFHLHRK